METLLPRLLSHLIWADERTAQSLASLPNPDADLNKLYPHILGAEATWLARINGEPPLAPWPDFDTARCAALAAKNHFIVFVRDGG